MYIHIHVILGQCTGGHATVSTGSCLTENTRHQPLYIWIGPDGQLGTLRIHAQIIKHTQVAKMYAWNHLAWHLSSCMRVIGKIYGRLQLRTWAESTRKFQGSRVVEEPLQNEYRERLKFNIIIVHSIRVIQVEYSCLYFWNKAEYSLSTIDWFPKYNFDQNAGCGCFWPEI